MSLVYVVVAMIFLHIVDDYYLQGWLASGKKKEYWQTNSPEKIYRYDYICALIMHSFSWAFMVMLPIALVYSFNIGWVFVSVFFANVVIHAVIDHLKANKKVINLCVDQAIHITQIILTAMLLL